MARVKETHTKKQKGKAVRRTPQEESGGILSPMQQKKPVEIEEPEAAAGLDEKAVEEIAPATEEGAEEAAEEIGIDDEELNPFGDKWEE